MSACSHTDVNKTRLKRTEVSKLHRRNTAKSGAMPQATCETYQQTGEETKRKQSTVSPLLLCPFHSSQPSSVAHKPPSHSRQQLDKKAEMDNSYPLSVSENPYRSSYFLAADSDNKRRRRRLVALAFSRHVWLPTCQTPCHIQGCSENVKHRM